MMQDISSGMVVKTSYIALAVKFAVEGHIYLSLTVNDIMTYKTLEGRLYNSGLK
jgi:hypothetical protein